MKRISISAATVILFACSVALGAQTSSANKPSPPRATRSARSWSTANPPQEITLTGCLQPGDQSNATASNAPTGAGARPRAQASAIPSFVLSSASQSGGGSGSYILQGLDLSRQTGQQVEVTGTMMPAPTARGTRNRATGTSGATTEANASMPRIRVTSVRMLSEHCSNQ
jgi:hypothetical protein